jgi:hypothetical protein
MPQKWQEHWPLPATLDTEARAERTAYRLERINRIGNLTLTSMPMNASLSNSEWRVKQKALNQGSKLLLNTEVGQAYPEAFDETSIDARGEWLAERICSIWPRPSAADTSLEHSV